MGDVEIWDGYDENGELLGIDLIRGEEIPKGVFHLAASVLVKHIDGSYLLMQRDLSTTWGGYFEATAGGAVLKGETPFIAAIREVKEETGIKIETPVFYDKGIDVSRQFILYCYIAETTCDKSAVVLQTGETMAYKWVDEREFLSFLKSDEGIPGQCERISNYLKLIEEE